jgi:hypothetical protein
MGTYTWVSAAAVCLLALVLWWGVEEPPASTRVSVSVGWDGALLEDARGSWEIRPGESRELPTGRYRLTLFAPDGRALRSEVEVGDEPLVLGDG